MKSCKKAKSFGKIPLFTPLSFYLFVFLILLLPLQTAFGASINVLTNPGFESGTTGWTARGSGVTISSGTSNPTPHSGTYRGRASGRTETWHGIQQNVLGKMVVGQTYQMSGWVRIASGTDTVIMTVLKTDGGGDTYTNVATGTANSTNWVQISGSYTLTVNGTLTQLIVYFETQNSATVNIFVDDASVYGPEPSSNATGNVNANNRHKVLEGFGASGAWYEQSVLNYSEPTRTNLFNDMFGNLGLDIYRVRNTYNIDNGYITRSATIIAAAATSLGHPIRIMNSSWSPPASLKSNGSTVGGTLAKDAYGNYRYADFAQWWRDSLNAWSAAGVSTYYVNMQNEPDWTANWDTCYFKPTQTDANAGYEQAFAALYTNLNSMPDRPKLLAPEGANISGTPSYVNALTATDKSNIYGYSHHLYDGDPNNPDGFITPMTNLKNQIGDRPLLQTEFSRGGYSNQWTNAMNLAILMHNALTVEEVSAYLYWELFWASPSGLISLTTPNYTINPIYYAFKHYSKFTDPNWQRVDATTNSTNLRISSYISPGNNQLSVVIINTSATDEVDLTLSFTGITFSDANVYRSSSTQNCVLIGTQNPANPIILPANTITTIACFNPDTTPPAAPTGLSATGGELMVTLNWNDNSEPDWAGYNVYRSTVSGGPYSKINGSLVTTSDYIDYDVDGYVTYYYVVRAVDESLNESGNSNQASATPTDTTPPLAPTGLSAIPGNGTVTLNWSDNGESDLAGYNVYRSTTSGSGYIQLNGTLLTSSDYIDDTVTNGITYYYIVTAVDSFSNESAGSAEVSAMPQIFIDVDIIGSWISGTTHAKEAGINRALVFFVHSEYSNTGVSLNSVTYGGRTMTKVIDLYLAGPSNGVYAAAFILNDANIVAADGSGTFNPSWTGSPSDVAYSSVFLGDVNQAALVGASASASGTTSSTITTSALATNIGDLVIEAATASSTGDFTLNNNFIEVNEYVMSSSEGVDGYKNAIGVAETPSITNTATRKVLIGFVVKAVPLAPPNNPPTVSITSPSDGAIFAQNANITIDATASDSDGTITKVEFYEGATKLGENTSAPYSYTWNNVPTGLYTLTAVATDDDSDTTTSPDVNITVLGAEGTGAVLSEWWTGITGTAVSNLTLDVNYPDNPSGEELLISLEGPVNWGDNYGTRIRGYLNPVATGSYTFWLASDADSELWLSTDDNPANATLRAYVPGSAQSSPVTLSAGQKYYIEVLHKEGTGNDNISVSWQRPGITQQVIDGIYLSPCCLDFENFADFATQWNVSGCSAGNDWCNGFDFGRDGTVSIDDLNSFADAWLGGI